MNVTERDVENIRRISEQEFNDSDYVDIEEVKDTSGDVMVRVNAADGASLGTRNAFAGSTLRTYHDNGYVAVAVGGGDENHAAWFETADSIEFGSPEPEGEYELTDDWTVVVGANAVLKHEGGTVAHVARDGWKLDEYVLHKVLPGRVTGALEDIGFEQAEIEP